MPVVHPKVSLLCNFEDVCDFLDVCILGPRKWRCPRTTFANSAPLAESQFVDVVEVAFFGSHFQGALKWKQPDKDIRIDGFACVSGCWVRFCPASRISPGEATKNSAFGKCRETKLNWPSMRAHPNLEGMQRGNPGKERVAKAAKGATLMEK